ncbi:MAG: hypothetical protein KC496_09070, partial [Anaerolineae bacterium]|nr:hypothetical protein [Anaerolineae bacterium]
MTTVIHTPFGQEHPYEQLPEERFPRRPLAGESFTVGIATQPVGGVAQVIVHSEVDSVPNPTVEAKRIADWQPELEEGVGAEYLERIVRIEQDVWHAALVAPQVGQTLTYWIEADGKQSERFTLVGETWTSEGSVHQNTDGSYDFKRGGEAKSVVGLPEILALEWLSDDHKARRVRLSFRCSESDGFYGLGERFNALNQRGNMLDVRVYEQYKNQGKRSYMPIPFLLVWSAEMDRGYGLFVDSSRWMQFDLAASDPNKLIIEADLGDDETLRLVPYHGEDPVAITAQFAQATGPIALPPRWSFGLWMSSNEWNSQARVQHETEQSLQHGIQPSVLVIEAWSDET